MTEENLYILKLIHYWIWLGKGMLHTNSIEDLRPSINFISDNYICINFNF